MYTEYKLVHNEKVQKKGVYKMDMEMQGSSSTERFIPVTSVANDKGVEVALDIYSYTIQIVNICF